MKRVFLECEHHPGFVTWLEELQELYFTDKHFLYLDNIYKVSKLGIRRRILAQSFKDPILRNLRNIVLDAIMSADQKTPGAGVWVPYFLLGENIDTKPQRSNSSFYLQSTLHMTNSPYAKKLFKSIWEVCGPMTRISLKTTRESSSIIRYRNSFQFKLDLDPLFYKMIGKSGLIEMTNPHIIMIEGAPETVSEINSLLEENNKTGKPCILIARSFPEEISATLATNWLKGSLSILPIAYGSKIETINLAPDMCAVSRGELISPVFGDVISIATLKDDKRGSCDRAEWKNGYLQVFKDVDVSRHISSLLNKIETTENDELREIISDRVTALSNDSIELQIPDKNPELLTELDMMIKHYNSFVISGYSNTKLGCLPNLILQTSQEVAESFRQEILKIAGFLIGVPNEKILEIK